MKGYYSISVTGKTMSDGSHSTFPRGFKHIYFLSFEHVMMKVEAILYK